MLKALHFLKGSIGSSDLLPSWQYLKLKKGFGIATNGTTTAIAPIDLNLDTAVKGADFYRALWANRDCKLSLTRNGNLKCADEVTVFVDTIADYSIQLPKGGTTHDAPPDLLDAFRTVLPFAGTDGPGYWSNAVALRHRGLYATNGACLIRRQTGLDLNAIVPASAVQEIIRIGENPTKIIDCGADLIFMYVGKRRLIVRLLDVSYPDLNPLLKQWLPSKLCDVANLFDALKKLSPFVQKSIYLIDNQLRTDRASEKGACIKMKIEKEAIFDYAQLMLLAPIAKKIDLSNYPDPVPFTGKKVVGLIAGQVH